MKAHSQNEIEMLIQHAKNMHRLATDNSYSKACGGQRTHVKIELNRVVNYLYKYGVNLTWLLI